MRRERRGLNYSSAAAMPAATVGCAKAKPLLVSFDGTARWPPSSISCSRDHEGNQILHNP